MTDKTIALLGKPSKTIMTDHYSPTRVNSFQTDHPDRSRKTFLTDYHSSARVNSTLTDSSKVTLRKTTVHQ